MSDITGKSSRTVSKRINEAGLQAIRKEGRAILYNSVDAMNAIYLPMIEAAQAEPASDIILDDERARETKERADNLALKNSQLRGELVPISAVKWLYGRTGAFISSALESLPVKLKRRNPKLNATDIDMIKGEIARLQNEMADMPLSFDDYGN